MTGSRHDFRILGPACPVAVAGMPARFHWIDALRGVAALVVVIFHYHHFYLRDYASRAEIPEISAFPWAAILGPIYVHGSVAVELFWVISGFVFAHVYLKRSVTAREFWVARIARLYPLHLTTLLAVAAIQAASFGISGTWQIYGNVDLRHFILQLFMASNWSNLSSGLSFNGPIWSVSLELVAYGLFFVSLPVLRRGGLPVAAGLCALTAWLQGATWFDPPLLRSSTLVCVAYFYFGTCIWFAVAACHAWEGRGRTRATAGLAAGLVAVAAAAGFAGQAAPAIAAGSGALIAIMAELDARRVVGATGPLGALGDMSYSLYLVHVPLQMALLTCIDLVAPGDRSIAAALWLLPVWLAVCCILAHWAHRRLELPAGRALRRLGRARVTGPGIGDEKLVKGQA